MQFALLMARLFLALVFGVAGIAKAADKAGSRRAIIDFGVPERLAPLIAWCLPLFEILVALALIPLSTAWWGAMRRACAVVNLQHRYWCKPRARPVSRLPLLRTDSFRAG